MQTSVNPTPNRRKSVAVIMYNATTGDTVVKMLGIYKIPATYFPDCEDGMLPYTQGRTFDIYLLDGSLTEGYMNGPACAAYIRNHQPTAYIIGMTGYSGPTEEDFLVAGANAVYNKTQDGITAVILEIRKQQLLP